MSLFKQARSAAVLAALGTGHTLAMSQVVVTYAPDIASVPTLSEWGMVIMAAVLATVAVLAIRKGAHSQTLLSLALAALVSYGAFSGSLWGGSAWANGFTTHNLTSASGGQLSVPTGPLFAYVLNGTDRPQRIISIAPQYGPPAAVDDKPACVPGMVLAPNMACALRTSTDS
ncbi:MAG: midcut-by-XrtH protein [Hydrogenophaga sp.]|jgi:hypothetical protein|nr:midcut-by-XrtH protein [Hydrogenophaga sp.]